MRPKRRISRVLAVVFGVDPDRADLVLSREYRYVSRLHCAVTYGSKTDCRFITDCSKNGTFTGDRKRLQKGKRTDVGARSTLLLADERCAVMLG